MKRHGFMLVVALIFAAGLMGALGWAKSRQSSGDLGNLPGPFALETLELPKDYALVTTPAPFSPLYNSPGGPATIVLRFTRELAPEAEQSLALFQNGSMQLLTPATYKDTAGNPAPFVYTTHGREIHIRNAVGAMPPGLFHLVGRRITAKDGSVLDSLPSLLLSSTYPTPLGVLPEAGAVVPLPKEAGSKRSVYYVTEPVALRETSDPNSRSPLRLKRGDAVERLGESEGQVLIRVYLSNGPASAPPPVRTMDEVLSRAARSVEGYVPASSVRELPASDTPGTQVLTMRNREEGLLLVLPRPYGFMQASISGPLTADQVKALEAMALLATWHELPGQSYTVSAYLTAGGEKLSPLDLRAHPLERSWSREEQEWYLSEHQRYVELLLQSLESFSFPATFPTVKEALARELHRRSLVHREWVTWAGTPAPLRFEDLWERLQKLPDMDPTCLGILAKDPMDEAVNALINCYVTAKDRSQVWARLEAIAHPGMPASDGAPLTLGGLSYGQGAADFMKELGSPLQTLDPANQRQRHLVTHRYLGLDLTIHKETGHVEEVRLSGEWTGPIVESLAWGDSPAAVRKKLAAIGIPEVERDDLLLYLSADRSYGVELHFSDEKLNRAVLTPFVAGKP